MAAKPETTFSNAVRAALPEGVYSMKSSNPYIAGIPDLWFSGQKGDLWVEMKFISRLPATRIVRPYELLSSLQEQWLRARYEEGRNVAVMIGCKHEGKLKGLVLRDLAWECDISPQEFYALIISKSELANFIKEQVM